MAATDASNRRWRLSRWILLATTVAILAVVVIPVVMMLQPSYYRRYPAVAQRMDHWAVSTHSRISCAECHVESGARGVASFAVRALPAFYSQLVQGPTERNLFQPPSRAACQKCHTAYRRVAPSGDLLIPHRAHVEVLDMDCVDCHRNLVHSLNRRGFNRPEMESCLEQCHDGDAASDECVSCHTRKQTPDTHKRADWLLVHEASAESEKCGECHDWTPSFCTECHEKRPASHVGNWKKDHAPHAIVRGDGCIVCHGGEKFCKECH